MTMLQSLDERRTDARVPIDILLNKYLGGRPHVVRASNLSRTGLLLHRVFEPDSDTRSIGLQFQLPGTDRVVTCAGRIVHRSGDAQGVVFTRLAPEHQQLIDAFVDRATTPR